MRKTILVLVSCLIAGLLLVLPADADMRAAMRWHDAEDYTRARHELMPLAVNGDASAAFVLGCLAHLGHGEPASDTVAAQWWQRAASGGHAGAQFNLGCLYQRGAGVPSDQVEANRWWHAAASQGYALAEVALGDQYRRGWGVQRNLTEALKWYQRAAERGDPEAQKCVGDLYFQGRGVKADAAEAERWWRRAEQHGRPCINLMTAIDELVLVGYGLLLLYAGMTLHGYRQLPGDDHDVPAPVATAGETVGPVGTVGTGEIRWVFSWAFLLVNVPVVLAVGGYLAALARLFFLSDSNFVFLRGELVRANAVTVTVIRNIYLHPWVLFGWAVALNALFLWPAMRPVMATCRRVTLIALAVPGVLLFGAGLRLALWLVGWA